MKDTQPPSKWKSTLSAFLSLTAGQDEVCLALRGLTLFMLEGHAPLLFLAQELDRPLAETLESLDRQPVKIGTDLDPDRAMARVDGLYVRHRKGLEPHLPEPLEFRHYLDNLVAWGYPLHAWVMGEMVRSCGLELRLSLDIDSLRRRSHRLYLYWMTHRILLDTGFLHFPPLDAGTDALAAELLAAVPWLREHRQVDLGAETAFCLQVLGHGDRPETSALLDLILAHRRPDGSVHDPGLEGSPQPDHTTAAALLALAGAAERLPSEMAV